MDKHSLTNDDITNGKTEDQRIKDDNKVSIDTLKRAIAGEPLRKRNVHKLAKALHVMPEEIRQDCSPVPVAASGKCPPVYTWEHLLTGARNVAGEIYRDGELQIDAVLTFPGPSSIFCGLVLTMLPLEVFMRIPAYTAMFVGSKTRITSQQSEHFWMVKAQPFNVLVPKHLVEDRTKRILVIDDTILTGGTMERMRKFFAKWRDSENMKFACCICYEGRTLPTENPPEIIGLPDLEIRQRFPMPWGRDSFCFEDAFRADDAHSRKLPMPMKNSK